MSKIVEKVWGHEDIIESNDLYTMKVLTLNLGYQSSLHYHPRKDETFLVIFGCCDLEVDGETRRMVQGDSQRLLPGVPHRFRAINDVCTIVEVSTPHSDSDVIRIAESRRIE